MKSIQKIALVLTKILELLHWVCTASMAALAICSVAAGPWHSGLLERILPQYRPELNTYGYEMTVTNAAGAVEPRAVLLFGNSAVHSFAEGDGIPECASHPKKIAGKHAVPAG